MHGFNVLWESFLWFVCCGKELMQIRTQHKIYKIYPFITAVWMRILEELYMGQKKVWGRVRDVMKKNPSLSKINQTLQNASMEKEDSSLFKWSACHFPRGDDSEKAKIHWGYQKSRTTVPLSVKLGTNLTKVRPLFTLSHRGSDNSRLLIVFSANYM